MIKKLKLIILLMLPLIVLANSELPDPTKPATYQVENIEPVYIEDFEIDNEEKINWKLSAIRISENDKTAIVNGKLVRVGDEVEAGKILEIKPLSVVIDHKEQKLIVRLFNTKVIKNYKPSK